VPLKKSTVQQNPSVASFDQMLTSRDLARRTVKCEFHA
jgi:hypothetical protein